LRPAVEYNYGSGDRNPADGRRQSFDPLYPTNVYGTAGDFGWRNLHEPAAAMDWQAHKKLKLRGVLHGYWLASRQDALYTFAGAVFARDLTARHSRVGTGYDIRAIWQASAHLQIYAGYACLFAGPFLREAGRSAEIHYPYAMWTYTF
jgi:hypothetical protein